MRIFFKNFLDIVILVWFLIKNQAAKIFFWAKNNLFIFFVVIFFVVIFFVFFTGEKQQEKTKESGEIHFCFNGDYSALEKEIVVEKGYYIINVSKENGFSILYPNAKDAKFFSIDSETIFLTFSFDDGEKKKMDGDFSQIFIHYKGKLKIWVKFNPKLFNPIIDRVWTGMKLPSGLIKEWDLVVSIKKADKYYHWIPEVVGIPESPETALTEPEPEEVEEKEETKTENNGKFFLGIPLPDLSEDKEGDEKGPFAPLSPEKQKEIKDRWNAASEEGWWLWDKIFSPDKKGEKGEKK